MCGLHDYIRAQELDDVLLETYILSKLISTIPATSTSAEMLFSALKSIKNYLWNTRPGNSAISVFAKDCLLDKLMSKETFFDEVIDILAGKTRRIYLQR
jgi:putative lipase involved disintegration of autophagic bodies